jgi:1-deoxy-D-xylulose-5-phosphate synthase
MTGPLLSRIETPADLRRVPRTQLRQVAEEVRQEVVDVVSQTGGHFGSNLGSVELTVALHYVFDTPRDRLVWDVGHQTYPHKILTGRRSRMNTLRQLGGVSGFPRREESEYDTFGVGHSSTSISAALGMARAVQFKGERRRVVAVIGDGALTAGMAFEAMNNAGDPHEGKLVDMLVVLNDNDMSISPPVGALNKYLARLMSGKFYAAARESAKNMLRNAPPLFELARRFEEHAKGMVVPGTIFEEFGFNYVGPIDGHDLDSLVPTLENLRDKRGPQFLHVVTKKGYGYKPAEADPVKYHAASGKFNPSEGFPKSAPSKPTFTQIFGQWLCDMAEADERLVAIAEQHAVTLAAGMACEGVKPVVALYSTFLQRGYDQLIHDVAIQNLPVMFALDRAGLVGADGATHAGAYDIAYLRCVPNVALIAPSDEDQCRKALTAAFRHNGPAAVRYPRGAGVGAAVEPALEALPWGRGEVRRHGRRIAILAFGTLLHPALAAAQALDATVADMKFIKPLDAALACELARAHDAVVTLEEGSIMAGIERPLLQLGLPDCVIEHGDPGKLLALCGLDAAGMERAIVERFGAALAAAREPAEVRAA